MTPFGYLGIDPGKSGGVAWVSSDGKGLYVYPTTDDEYALSSFFSGYKKGEAKAVLEKVHAFPGQGVSSMFTFGRGYGFLRGCLVSQEIPFEDVTPQAWQKALGIPKKGKDEKKTDFKKRLRAKAQQLFPSFSSEISLAVGDAVLIAEYARRRGEGLIH